VGYKHTLKETKNQKTFKLLPICLSLGTYHNSSEIEMNNYYHYLAVSQVSLPGHLHHPMTAIQTKPKVSVTF